MEFKMAAGGSGGGQLPTFYAGGGGIVVATDYVTTGSGWTRVMDMFTNILNTQPHTTFTLSLHLLYVLTLNIVR